ncbi:MAG: hypothetical protein HOP30_08450 [Cyclobacteriaceae bacterium]|nr:hypothetical protein [Cyclobacteriaceae bacterium]
MKKLILFYLLFISLAGIAQQQELATLVNKIQASCSKVETATKTYEQDVKLLDYSSIRYSFNEVDQKGTKVSYAYDFNFADIDINTVREVTQKDIILVVLSVRNKQKLVKGSRNGESTPYDDEVSIHAKNVDHAREISDLIKKCIPLGEKITAAKLKLTTHDQMVDWLVQNVKNSSTGSKSITQNLKQEAYVASFKLLQITSDGKTSQQEEFIFNLADINLNTINFKVSGNQFGVGFEMNQRLKSIKSIKDGKKKPPVDDLVIFTNSVDEARDIKTVISLVAPMAANKVKADIPLLKTEAEALKNLESLVKDVKINEKTFAQSLSAQCITSLTILDQSASSTVKNVYQFNWMDINPNTIQIKVSGEKMGIELSVMDKKKLMMNYKNDKLDGYENELFIYVEDIEIGRRLKNATEKTIANCKSSYKEPFSDTNAQMLQWLKSNIGEVTIEQASIRQIFELAEEGNENKIKLTNIEIKSSSSVQEVMEFNLSDLNPNSITYEMKGKWIFVRFETNFKSKIIKAYKEGKIQPYISSSEIVVKDIETARGTIAALKKLCENLKGK